MGLEAEDNTYIENFSLGQSQREDEEKAAKILSVLNDIATQVQALADVPQQLSTLHGVVEASSEKLLESILQTSSYVPPAASTSIASQRKRNSFVGARIGRSESFRSMASDALFAQQYMADKSRRPSCDQTSIFENVLASRRPSVSTMSAYESAYEVATRRPSVCTSAPPYEVAQSVRRPSLPVANISLLPNVAEESTGNSTSKLANYSPAEDDNSPARVTSKGSNVSEGQEVSPALWMRRMSSSSAQLTQFESHLPKLTKSMSANIRESLQGTPRSYMLLPGSWARLIWIVCMLIVTVLIGILVPLNYSYWEFPELGLGGGLVAAYMIIDVFLIMDVVVRFRTAFESSSGEVVTDARSVASRYLQTWCIANILAAWPTFLLFWNGSIPLALKLLRVLELQSLFVHVQNNVHHVRLTWLKVSVSVFLVAHSMACAWRAIQHAHGTDEIDRSGWASQYVVDLYWVVMTMTTVGYGDIQIVGTAPRLFAIVCMLVGAAAFGFMLTMVSAAMHRFLDDEIGKTLAEVKGFMIYRRTSQELQIRIERNLRDALLTERKETMRQDIFAKLSQVIQCDLSLEILSGVILEFPLFTRQPRNFIGEIARAHNFVRALQGDVVVEEGQLVQELIFVVQGQVMILEPDGFSTHKERIYGRGAWLGEACLFMPNVVRDHSAVATQKTELAVLAVESYHSVKQNYPHIVEWHEELRKQVASGELKMAGLSYRALMKLKEK